MWQQLQCDYYLELIITLLMETYLTLDAEACKLEECLARKSNVESAICILQNLLLTYRSDKLLPDDYFKLYSPLIDLKAFIKAIDEETILSNKDILCNELMFYEKNIRNIYNQAVNKR